MLLKVVTRTEDLFYTASARLLLGLGWRPEILGFGGIGSTATARVIGRVLMSPTPMEEKFENWVKTSGIPTLEDLTEAMDKAGAPAANILKEAVGTDEATTDDPTTTAERGERGWRQFLDAQIPFHPVLVTVGSRRRLVYADRGGYVDVDIEDHGLTPGWHRATMQALDPKAVERGDRRVRGSRPVSVPLRIVGEFEEFGIVSDVDDTVMISYLPRPLVAAKNAFISYVSSRQAVPGMSRFLTALAVLLGPEKRARSPRFDEGGGPGEGASPGPRLAAVVYLSTGAWNVAPSLRRFLARCHFPFGTPLLTDWGPSQTGWFRSGQAHKRSQLRELTHRFPWVKWVLVGDDGQHDPAIYADFARAFPSRVAAICIRSLSATEQVLTHGAPTSQERVGEVFAGVDPSIPLLVGEDGHELLRIARARGVV